MWDQMLLGIQTAFTLQNMLFAGLGCFIGTIIGITIIIIGTIIGITLIHI